MAGSGSRTNISDRLILHAALNPPTTWLQMSHISSRQIKSHVLSLSKHIEPFCGQAFPIYPEKLLVRVVALAFKQARPLWTDSEFYDDFKSGTIVFVSSISSSSANSKV